MRSKGFLWLWIGAVCCLPACLLLVRYCLGGSPIPAVGRGGAIRALDVTDLADGGYYLQISGNTFLIRPLNLYRVGPSPTPQPDLTARAKAIYRAVLSAKADSEFKDRSERMIALYRQVAGEIRDGTMTSRQNAAIKLREQHDIIVPQNVRPLWTPMLQLFADHWAAMVQEGAELEDYADYLEEAANGLGAAI